MAETLGMDNISIAVYVVQILLMGAWFAALILGAIITTMVLFVACVGIGIADNSRSAGVCLAGDIKCPTRE